MIASHRCPNARPAGRPPCLSFPNHSGRSHSRTYTSINLKAAAAHPEAKAPPGLRLIPKFLYRMEQARVLDQALKVFHDVTTVAKDAKKVPAKTYLSQQHNLDSHEFYQNCTITDVGFKEKTGQHFKKYGEDGHTLTYFIGNQNIPYYIGISLIPLIEELEEVKALKAEHAKEKDPTLGWRLTLNTYSESEEQPGFRPGFPFHIDTPTNGRITSIVTLISPARIEMKKKEENLPSYSLVLKPGSLLLLSGESRWNWQHRVLQENIEPATNRYRADIITPEFEVYRKIKRVSLVLGCQVIV